MGRRLTDSERVDIAKEVKRRRYNPGERCELSGQYADQTGDQITMVRGRRFPPGVPGKRWRLTDWTRTRPVRRPA